VGSVIGTATVGALLQNRLAASLASQATTRSAQLPPKLREPFISAFTKASSSGLQPGSSAGFTAPRGTPPATAAELQRLGTETFSHGYVTAMQWTMVLPIAMVALAAVSCLLVRNRGARSEERRV